MDDRGRVRWQRDLMPLEDHVSAIQPIGAGRLARRRVDQLQRARQAQPLDVFIREQLGQRDALVHIGGCDDGAQFFRYRLQLRPLRQLLVQAARDQTEVVSGRRDAGEGQLARLLRVKLTNDAEVVLVGRCDKTGLRHAKTSGASADLVNFAWIQLAIILAIELFHLVKANHIGRQVQPHANGIGCDADFGLASGEAISLPPPHLGRQTAVDHRHRPAQPFQFHLQIEHALTRECHQNRRMRKRFQCEMPLRQRDRRQTLMLDHFAGDLRRRSQHLDQVARRRRSDDVHFRRRRFHQRARPGPAAIGISQHLRLINDHAFAAIGRVEHLNRGGCDSGAFHRNIFFAGQELASDAIRVQPVKYFIGQ